MTITSVSVTAKSRTIVNGTANDATVPEANFVDLYSNDQAIASGLNSVIGVVNNLTPLGGIKNLIIGGDFSTNPWQRGISFSNPAAGAYTADRFLWNSVGSGTVNISQISDTPSLAQCGRFVNYSLKASVATADSSLTNHIYYLEHRIEGFNYLSIAQKPFTLSFWVKSALSGIHCVSFRNAGADQSYTAEYTISTANTWQFVAITVPASPSAGTWNYTNGIGLDISWVLGAGCNTGTAGSWTASNVVSSVNQVNIMASTANFFQLALVQIESGQSATAFESRSVQQELSLCQRYFYQTISGVGGYSAVSNQNWTYTLTFPSCMRSAPAITYLFASGSNYGTISTVQNASTSIIVQQVLGSGNGYCYQTIVCNAEL